MERMTPLWHDKGEWSRLMIMMCHESKVQGIDGAKATNNSRPVGVHTLDISSGTVCPYGTPLRGDGMVAINLKHWGRKLWKTTKGELRRRAFVKDL